LNPAARGPRMGPRLMMAGSSPATCQDAPGLRAGAIIAVLGGRCAERRVAVATAIQYTELKNEDDDA
jgi:hypothetical protein